MTLGELTQQSSEWLRGVGPMHDIVISSRIRLARNLAGMPFLPKCQPAQHREILHRLREQVQQARLAEKTIYVDVAEACDLDRQLLVERHLISRQHAEADHPRGAVIGSAETVSVMINEEDHLRVQVLRSGLQLHEAFEAINVIDDKLEERVDFAFSKRFGYLTACPTNVGTGMRVSVMLHLPALKLTGELEKALRAARDMRMAIRGLYGEGTDATGDFFQLSNQVTLGVSEEQIVEQMLTHVVPAVLKYERAAREAIARKDALRIDDRIHRSFSVLRSARLIGSEETLFLLSMVRLGVNLGRLKDVDLHAINELMLLVQPAHLQKTHGQPLSKRERAELRATEIRQRLGGK